MTPPLNHLKQWRWVLLGLIVLSLGAAIVFVLGSEPRFEGKSLNSWLKVYDTAFQAGRASPALNLKTAVEMVEIH